MEPNRTVCLLRYEYHTSPASFWRSYLLILHIRYDCFTRFLFLSLSLSLISLCFFSLFAVVSEMFCNQTPIHKITKYLEGFMMILVDEITNHLKLYVVHCADKAKMVFHEHGNWKSSLRIRQGHTNGISECSHIILECWMHRAGQSRFVLCSNTIKSGFISESERHVQQPNAHLKWPVRNNSNRPNSVDYSVQSNATQ